MLLRYLKSLIYNSVAELRFYKSKSDGLWWVKDQTKHGGSFYKVYKETNKGLEWHKDADKYGNFIINKHKSDVGIFIPWKELSK